MALQNLELKGKKARYDWIKPFDKIAFYASRQAWLENRNVNITSQFVRIFKVFEDVLLAQKLKEDMKAMRLHTNYY